MTTARKRIRPGKPESRVHGLVRGALSGLAAAAAASLLLAACSNSSSTAASGAASSNGGSAGSSPAGKSLTQVTVAYVPLPLFEPLFVAMSDGLFAKHGIEVHLTEVGSGQSAIALAATNRVQVVLGGFSAGLFNGIHQGLNFKVVGSMAEEAPGTAANGLVAANSLYKSGKVTNAGELKGMKIAVDGGAGSTGAYLVAQALAPYHVSLSQVTLENLAFPEMASALKTGAVAAAYLSSPFLAAAVSGGDGTLVSSAQVGVAATGVIYGGAFAKTPAAQQFFDALVEAAQRLQGKNSTSQANLSIVAKATGDSLSALQAEPPNEFSPTLAPPASMLDNMQQVFMAAGSLNYTTAIPSSAYLDETFSSSAS